MNIFKMQFWKYHVYKTMTFEIEKSQAETVELLKKRLKWTISKSDERLVISSTSGNFGRSHIDVFIKPVSEQKTEITFKLHTLIHIVNHIGVPAMFLFLIFKTFIETSRSVKANQILFVVIIFLVVGMWLVLNFHELGARFFTKRFIKRLIKDISK